MKKFLFYIFLLYYTLNSNAQHISFLEISLGQSSYIFDKQLKQKGFKYIGEFEENGISYLGDFWKFTNTSLNTRVIENKVTEVLIHIPKTNISENSFYDIVSNLNKKYGKYCSVEKGLLLSYNWSVLGGAIQTSCDINEYHNKPSIITIRYIDNTSIFYSNPKKRDRNNDL